MNDEDIQQFMNAFEDFLKHAQVQEVYHQSWESARNYTQSFYEQKASELGVSTEYYIAEFV